MSTIVNINSNRNLNKETFNNDEFSLLEKAYTEGVYADTPANRKLGRVGMTYKEFAEKQKKESEGGEQKSQEEKKEEPKKEKGGYKYMDTPINRKLGRVGMTEKEWHKQQEENNKGEKNNKEEDNNKYKDYLSKNGTITITKKSRIGGVLKYTLNEKESKDIVNQVLKEGKFNIKRDGKVIGYTLVSKEDLKNFKNGDWDFTKSNKSDEDIKQENEKIENNRKILIKELENSGYKLEDGKFGEKYYVKEINKNEFIKINPYQKNNKIGVSFHIGNYGSNRELGELKDENLNSIKELIQKCENNFDDYAPTFGREEKNPYKRFE